LICLDFARLAFAGHPVTLRWHNKVSRRPDAREAARSGPQRLFAQIQAPPLLFQLGPGEISPAQTGDRLDHLQDLPEPGRLDLLHDPGAGQRGAGLGDGAACNLAHFPRVLGQLPELFDLVALTPPVGITAATPFTQVLRVDRMTRPVPFQHLPHRRLGIEPRQNLRTAPAIVEAAVEFDANRQRQGGDLSLARDIRLPGRAG
jgi:hypothetical protein